MKITLEIYQNFMKENNLNNYCDLLDYRSVKSKELDHLLSNAPIWPPDEAYLSLANIKDKEDYYFFVCDILSFYYSNRNLYNLK